MGHQLYLRLRGNEYLEAQRVGIVLMRWLVAAVVALFVAPAIAAPTLTGPLIKAVTTDLQSYQPAATATVLVTLVNNTGAAFTGSVAGSMSGRGVTMGTPYSIGVTALAPGATQLVRLQFFIPGTAANRGYLVSITATAAGVTVDTAGAALDVASDWSVYPRECFVTNFTAGTAVIPLAAGLNAWHCNILQFYDVNYKHHVPYNSGATWNNLGNSAISRYVVEGYIGAAHALNIAAFDYTLWNGAYPDFQTDSSGVSLSWGQFATNCSPSCALTDLTGTPSTGGLGALFPSPWAALWLAETDPTNASWITYFENVNAPLVANLAYDGLQIDTLGYPGTVYKSTGTAIDFTTALSAFENSVRDDTNIRGVLNNVSGWDDIDVMTNSREDFYYSERHPEFGDVSFYPNVNSLTATIQSITTKGIDLAIYMNSTYSNTSTCISGGGTTPCYFNLPGLLYADSTIMASGAYHVYLADGDRFVSNIYIPGPQLLMSPSSTQAEFDYQSFGVAYEKLLRSGVTTASQTASITSGATGSTVGAAGAVYILPKIRSGLQILHLLNYSQASTNAVQDTNATTPAPTPLSNVAVKMYYSGSVTGSNKLWFASPDTGHGKAVSLTYTKGSDGGGTFITFTAPSLLYWDMFWLELDSLSSSDYASP